MGRFLPIILVKFARYDFDQSGRLLFGGQQLAFGLFHRLGLASLGCARLAHFGLFGAAVLLLTISTKNN
jgi:hypothetical protein